MQAPESTVNQSDPAKQSAFSLLRLMRPKQWTKNLIVLAPMLFAAKLHDPQLVLNALLCFVAFCLLSSSLYIFNDILDKDADKLHPIKCRRPISSGEISLALAWTLCSILAPAALALSFYVRPTLVLVFVAYLVLNVLYSAVLKHIAIVDVLTIAMGFLLRAMAGAVAVKVPLSSWFLLCAGLGAIFLALEKRRSELTTLQSAADSHRPVLQRYSAALIDRLEGVVLPGLLISYIFYSFLSIHGQWMMLSVPFVIYGIMRYQQLSSQNDASTGAPEDVLLKDRPIQIAIVLWLLTCAGVLYGVIQHAVQVLVSSMDSLVR
ncbi:MAG: decaprenyl-phosphate phosphoribosyltransferase [Candidatus Obscuribacterales bacterium]|nr:decaprenyl-phosphate phosphoribosyltransferase [Candidatus Obscuribacterales bacterium]